jgi:hypothetical protein
MEPYFDDGQVQMSGYVYLAMASQQRGVEVGPNGYDGERLRFFCVECESHRVVAEGDRCPCCPEVVTVEAMR